MVDIILTDQTIQISSKDKNELKEIKRFETFNDNKAAFSKSGFDPRKVKAVSLLKEIQGRLVGFVGLAKEIIVFCNSKKIKINKVEDKRTHFDFQSRDFSDEEIRKYFNPNFKYVDHQVRTIKAMLKTNKALLALPTSAGKSAIMTAFMKITNIPTLILTDRSTLGAQLADGFRQAGLDCGFCAGNGVRQGFNMVSTIQSVKKLGDIHRFQAVLVDECHRSSSKSFQDFFTSFGCPLKYGFSASPSNGNLLDFAKIRQHLGSIAIQVKADELIENEVMAKPIIRLVETDCQPTFDYNSAYDLGIVKNELRNNQIKEIVDLHRDIGGICILVRMIEHGEILENLIEGSVFLRGEDSLQKRQEIIEKFNNGEIPVLIGSGILNEGISISNMKVCAMTSSGKATTQTIQKIGRVLRITPDKKEGIFYDFVDIGNKYLYKHSLARIKLYKAQGYDDITLVKSMSELYEKKDD